MLRGPQMCWGEGSSDRRHVECFERWTETKDACRCWFLSLTWVWPARSRTGAPWRTDPPAPASPRCWCWRRSAACWPASCNPRRSSGAGIRSPSPAAASPSPSAASWAPASGCRWPRRLGPCGGSGNAARSSWTRRPWPYPLLQFPAKKINANIMKRLIKTRFRDLKSNTWTRLSLLKVWWRFYALFLTSTYKNICSNYLFIL